MEWELGDEVVAAGRQLGWRWERVPPVHPLIVCLCLMLLANNSLTNFQDIPFVNNLLNTEVLQKKNKYENICFFTSLCICRELTSFDSASKIVTIFRMLVLDVAATLLAAGDSSGNGLSSRTAVNKT